MDIKKTGLKTWRIISRTILGLILFILLYAVFAFLFSVIPVNSDKRSSEGEIAVFILSNGVHTDIVLPAKSRLKDWRTNISYTNTLKGDSAMQWLAFGWGDKGFYLETPQWSDLKARVACKAMFHLGSSAMHCTYYTTMDEGASCKKILLKQEQYEQLCSYIRESFTEDNNGNVQHIAGHSYGIYDAFYEANRTYSLFYTCNTWANNALKSCGQKACLWTPSDKGIFYQYR